MANSQQGVTIQVAQPKRRRMRRRQRTSQNQQQQPQRARGRNQRPRRRRRQRPRAQNATKNEVQREVKRLGLTGPAPTIVQRATATLGSVQPNQSGNLELEFQMCLNPSLVKEATGSNQFGPIQISASTYSLWKLRSAIFHFQPLVGSSAVSGTVYRISLNLSGSPGSNSWSALGARFHMDVTPGQSRKFHVPKRMLQGTKEGWFQTDPKSDPTNSLGGSVEVHSLGKTMSTYQATQFTGDLFLLEMTATWEFTNYNAQPGLLTMVKDTHQSKMEMTSQGNGSPLIMEVPVDSKLSNYTGGSSHAASASGTLGETIWSIVDTGVSTLSGVVPPPFGWLVKGGWWFVRRIFGKKLNSANEEVAQFYVYQTLADAQNDNRCITTSSETATATSGEYEIQQITPGNVGLSDTPGARVYVTPAALFDPTKLMNVRASYQSYVRPVYGITNRFQATLYGPRNFTSYLRVQMSNPSLAVTPMLNSVVRLEAPRFEQSGQDVVPDASLYQNHVPIEQVTNAGARVVANAVGYTSYQVDYANVQMRIVHLLFYLNESIDVSLVSLRDSVAQYITLAPQWSVADPPALVDTFAVSTEGSLAFTGDYLLPAGHWYMATTIGIAATQTLYGIRFGARNHDANLGAGSITSLPLHTPWNQGPDGFILYPVPTTQRIQVYEPQLYDHESETDDDTDYESGSEESDIEDYHVPPADILYDFTEDAQLLCLDLQDKGIERVKAAMASQECFPSSSYKQFQGTYDQLLIDGCSPPFSRAHAIKAAQPFISRGHAE